MKKLLATMLLSLGIVTAVQAQSSVTIYGILDVGFVGGSEKDTVNNTTSKQQANGFGSSAQSTSRLGFRGQENLGGGMSAFFTFETQITPQDTNYTTNANRQAFVGIGQKGIGRASIGTQYTTLHNALVKTDPGMVNNMAGSVINPQATGVTGSSSSDGNNLAYTVRANNMLALQSDNFAGLAGSAFYDIGRAHV
jgi:predicted porin